MDVSIIILNYKNKGLIQQELKHFLSQKTSLRVEIIVVDNDSHDGIGDMIATDFPGVRFLASPTNSGFAAGNNIGIRAAQGRYIMLVNPDLVLTAVMVEGLFQFMEASPTVGIVGPKLINADGSLQYSCFRFPDFWVPFFRRTALARTAWGKKRVDEYFMKDWDYSAPRDVDWLLGACLMVRRTALDTVGYLDERFYMYVEDTDWCRRFWEKGYGVWYVPTVSVVHLHRRSSEGFLVSYLTKKTARDHLKSFFKYLIKYLGKKNPHTTYIGKE